MWNWSLYSLSKQPLLVQRNFFLFSVHYTSRNNNNRIQRSSYQYSRILKVIRFYSVGDDLICSDDLRDFTRSDGYKKSRVPSWIFLFPGLFALKSVGLDKSPGIDGLPYEVYLRLSHMFVPLLATIYNNWMRQGTKPRRFTRGIVKLLRKNKHGGDGISNFRPLTMLNTDKDFGEDPGKLFADCPA